MKSRVHSVAMASAVVVVGMPIFASSAGEGEGAPIAMRFSCGTTLLGKPASNHLDFVTKYADLPVEWSSVRSMESTATSGVWRLRLEDGNLLVGHPRAPSIPVVTALGLRDVKIGSLTDLQSTAADGAVPGGLVLYLPLDDLSGERAADASGNGLDGEVHDGEWVFDGRWGGALRCIGTSDRGTVIRIPNGPRLNSPSRNERLTVSCWIQPISFPTEFPVILCKGGNQRPNAYGGFELHLSAAAPTQLNFTSGGTSSHATPDSVGSTPFGLGAWTHVACTVDGATRQIVMYANGRRMKLGGITLSSPSGRVVLQEVANDLFVGGPDPGHHPNRAWFDGLIDEFMLFDRVLSDAEIARLFQLGASGIRPFKLRPADTAIEVVLDLAGDNRIVGRCMDEQIEIDAAELGPACIPRNILAGIEVSVHRPGHQVRLLTGDRLEARMVTPGIRVDSILGVLDIPWKHIRKAMYRPAPATTIPSAPAGAAKDADPESPVDEPSSGPHRTPVGTAGMGDPAPGGVKEPVP